MINIDELNAYLAKISLSYKFISMDTSETIKESDLRGNKSYKSSIGSLIVNEKELSFISNSKDAGLLLVIAVIVDMSTGFNQTERNDALKGLGMYDGSFIKSKKLEFMNYEFRIHYSKRYGLMFQIFNESLIAKQKVGE